MNNLNNPFNKVIHCPQKLQVLIHDTRPFRNSLGKGTLADVLLAARPVILVFSPADLDGLGRHREIDDLWLVFAWFE